MGCDYDWCTCTDWNFHKYVGFFHNYLFDMLGEYLATGNIDYAKYTKKQY